MGDSLTDRFENSRPQLKVWVYDDKGNRTVLNASTVQIMGDYFLGGGFISIDLPIEDDGTLAIRFKNHAGDTQSGDAPAVINVDRDSSRPVQVIYNPVGSERKTINFDEDGRDMRSRTQRFFDGLKF